MNRCTLCGRDDKTATRLLTLSVLVFLAGAGVLGALIWALIKIDRPHVVVVPVPLPVPTPSPVVETNP